MNNAKFKMKKIILISIIFFIGVINTSAQNNETSPIVRKNAIFLEGGGSALWYSLNYEHRYILKPMHRITLGAGTSLLPLASDVSFIGFLSAGYLYGNTHSLEIGGSAGSVFTEKEFVGSIRIGYRYEGPKGLLFRVGFSPVYTKFAETGLKEYSGKGFVPWAYISLGYTF